MPLNIEVLRGGEARKLSWDYFTLSCCYTAALKEGDPEFEYAEGKKFGELEEGQWVDFSMAPIYYLDSKAPLLKNGRQVLHRTHKFGELTLEAGDEIRAWRSYKS